MGAFISMKGQVTSAQQDAYIALAGPIFGTGAAMLTSLLGFSSNRFLILSHTLSLFTLVLAHTLFFSLFLSHTRSLTHTLFLSHTCTLSRTLFLSLTLVLSHLCRRLF